MNLIGLDTDSVLLLIAALKKERSTCLGWSAKVGGHVVFNGYRERFEKINSLLRGLGYEDTVMDALDAPQGEYLRD